MSAAGRLDSDGRFEARAVEIAPQAPERIGGWPEREGAAVRVFHEAPLDDRLEARLDAIARARAAAKVRTGGVEARAFQSAERLAGFIDGCVERRIPFKATAGLHHPLRGRYALTYEQESERCEMFGFLEVALVSTLLRSRRIDTREAAELLGGEGVAEGVPPRSDGDALVWAGHRVDVAEIAELRSELFLSFGSCSFEEPVADLEGLGLL